MSNNNNDQIKMTVPYFQVPNSIFDEEDLNLDTYEKLVYIYLARCGNHGGTAFPSYNTIAEKCSMCKRKAIKCVQNLKNEHLLVVQKRPKGNMDNDSNIYKINTPGEQYALGGECHALASEQGAPYKELDYKELDYKEKENLYTQLKLYGYETTDIYNRLYEITFNREHPKVLTEKLPDMKETLLEIKGGYGTDFYINMIKYHFNECIYNYEINTAASKSKLDYFVTVKDRYLLNNLDDISSDNI